MCLIHINAQSKASLNCVDPSVVAFDCWLLVKKDTIVYHQSLDRLRSFHYVTMTVKIREKIMKFMSIYVCVCVCVCVCVFYCAEWLDSETCFSTRLYIDIRT
jgi:hypothetical protein